MNGIFCRLDPLSRRVGKRLGIREEDALVRAQDKKARDRESLRVVHRVAELQRSRQTDESTHSRFAGPQDQCDQRDADCNQQPNDQIVEREDSHDGHSRENEVRSANPIEPTKRVGANHPGDCDDDDCSQRGLWQIGKDRGQEESNECCCQGCDHAGHLCLSTGSIGGRRL